MEIRDIIKARKTLISYFSYPAYSAGDLLCYEEAKEDNYDTLDTFSPISRNSDLVNCIDEVIFNAVKILGIRRDNKTAVKVIVEGMPEPLYFYSFDSTRSIRTGINTSKGSTEHSLIQESAQNQKNK